MEGIVENQHSEFSSAGPQLQHDKLKFLTTSRNINRFSHFYKQIYTSSIDLKKKASLGSQILTRLQQILMKLHIYKIQLGTFSVRLIFCLNEGGIIVKKVHLIWVVR